MRAGVVLDGRYELRERLGEGGMGEVWRGHDRCLDRAVAVKTVRDTARPLLLARLEREARAAGRLTHPHIVAVHDSNRVVFEGVPAVYLVMELLPGLPLALLEDLIPDLVRTRRRRSRLTRAARTALARERQRCW
ncbi:protein kinase domain-containing protein [Streptomyces zhihengii]